MDGWLYGWPDGWPTRVSFSDQLPFIRRTRRITMTFKEFWPSTRQCWILIGMLPAQLRLGHGNNTSLAAKGALAHHLQHTMAQGKVKVAKKTPTFFLEIFQKLNVL